ncbi:ricin-type beta-trefoil lectin domain protein [Streptomyces sp. NBC_00873]|uniref:alkaline phosphatase family protein n=1 Tax=unclassified Streptomyces TaxID=2593676 RepID=UPI00386EA478|nr:ricin-type beta-trefoil lectin domain protein [Streptomyces sp. NBC_00873]WTA41870.1 ricin-type beta-trefoil lectin domain protein [Streptomyces sp. NBC_00842]
MGSTAVPKPDHVVMVMMENKGYDDILRNPSTRPQDQVPYIKSLEAQGASFTNSYGVTHPSLPNYYALLSASDIVKSSAWPDPQSVDTDNLPNQLVTHGYSFANYANQGLPTQWLRYKNIPGTPGNLNPMDKRQEEFPTTPDGFAKLPTVSFYVGNGQQSMHDGTLAQGDAFVKNTFDSYIQWAKTHNSLFVLTWDEDDFTPANHIPTIMVGPMAKAGEYDQKINHYNVLRTMLDMYGLDHINHTADADVSTITDVWDMSKTARLRGMAGRCLENHQTDPAEPGSLGLWHCEAAANQQWIRHADGTIHHSDKCLAATADGKGTELADCDGTPAQNWQPKADGSLLNPASGRCLTVPGANVANGTPAELQNCDGKLHQKWIVPSYNAHHSLTVDTPTTVKPGSTATVTTTYTNDGSPVALSDASVNLTVPSGWTAEATSPTTFTTVKPGQSVKTTWTATAPADAKPGPYALSAQATFKNAKSSDNGTASVDVPYTSLAAAFNSRGISDDKNASAGGFDITGHSYSAQALAAQNLTPGATVTAEGATFTWPNVPAGVADNVNSTGQKIEFSGKGSKLAFLGSGVYGPLTGTGTVTYTDGTTQTFSAGFSDWTLGGGSGSVLPTNSVVAKTAYRNKASGPENIKTYVFSTSVPIDPSKTIEMVQLPKPASGYLHIFGMATAS